ncbi:MAG: class I SAM-dependent methyltransferase [Alphaproteobacteria bacterium]|nr:class I SAM-dependent methyltransferase [Alphaproteobacteria bacterium]
MTLWKSFIHNRLSRAVTSGALELTYPDGTTERYGEAGADPVRARLRHNKWVRRLVLDPELALGEAYMEGGLQIEGDKLYALLDLIWGNILSKKHGVALPGFMRRALRRLAQFNPAGRAKKNVAHHYDVGNDLYRLFLDEDMQYSCAYFEQPNISLEDAQKAKKDLIAKKLLIKPHHSVLEIGSGWGGLGISLAEEAGAEVTSVTLSEEQLRVARMRASAKGLSDQAQFQLQDYRATKGSYDRIVSVGMFEHVGVPHFQTYFDHVAQSLNEDGVALIHTIGRPHGPGATDAWTAKHIFPGGYIPALSEIMPAIERAGLVLTDLEVWRLHYAETLREWRRRFKANAEKITRKYDARFIRMWNFYLVVSELSFRYGVHVVFQLQLAKRQDAVPLTRDYLATDHTEHSYHDERERKYA